MDVYEQMLAAYPDPMSRTQLRKAAHIGTRTSQYLLQSGLVPCINTGKKTRCYKIAKKDVIRYLKDRDLHMQDYLPPSEWYRRKKGQPAKPRVFVPRIDYNRVPRERAAKWYERQFESAPDALDVQTAAALLGYSRKALTRWCSTGALGTVMRVPKYLIPKKWLIEFVTSDTYNEIRHKSEKHLAAIEAICRKK